MNGGGWISDPNQLTAGRIHDGMELHCRATALPNNLELNFGGITDPEQRNYFHLSVETAASCVLNVPSDPEKGGTHTGSGLGSCNGRPASAAWTFTDSGKASERQDMAQILIRGDDPACAVDVVAPLQGGQFGLYGDPNR